jgi:hypothetical protein
MALPVTPESQATTLQTELPGAMVAILGTIWSARKLHHQNAWWRLWQEITDPLTFCAGAAILFFSDRESRTVRFCRLAFAVWIVFVTVVFALATSVGNVVAYAGTLAVAGVLILLPGRIGELRHQGRLAGRGYPKTLRIAMCLVEFLLVAMALILSHPLHAVPVIHGIAAGAVIASSSDLFTMFGSLAIAAIIEWDP